VWKPDSRTAFASRGRNPYIWGINRYQTPIYGGCGAENSLEWLYILLLLLYSISLCYVPGFLLILLLLLVYWMMDSFSVSLIDDLVTSPSVMDCYCRLFVLEFLFRF
jgi:hypothetical protein